MSVRDIATGRILWRLIRYEPRLYATNALLWVTVWSMPVVLGLITKAFFDRISGEMGATFSVPTLIAFVAAYFVGRIGLVFLALFNDAHFTFRITGLLRRNLLGRILELPGARAVEESPGEAISRFREDVEHTEEAVDWTVDILGALVFSTIAFVVLFNIDARITLFVFAPLVLVIIIAERAGDRIRRYRLAAREATERITGALGEMFGSVQSIKVAGAESNMIRHFQGLNEERRKVMVRDRVLNEVLESVFWNTVNIGTGIILILAADAMSGGGPSRFTVGEFALFVYFLTFVTDAVHFVGVFLARYRQAGVSIERMAAMLRGPGPDGLVVPQDLELAGPRSTYQAEVESGEALRVLEVEGLSYRYPGTVNGIEDVSLRLERGSFTVITGRIGSGKTTLLRALQGLLTAQSGVIRWNGDVVADPARFFVPPHSAYTPQVPKLFSMSLRDNLLLGLRAPDRALEEAISSAVLTEDVTGMTDGLETQVGPLGIRLSGGQVQRAAAARMFVRRPDLLIFDDLSSALDVETEAKLWERLFRGDGDVTSLVVSHRRAALQRADHVIVMSEGSIAAQGTLNELLGGPEELHSLWAGGVDA